MQAMVTGGSGFIGSEIISQLVRQGVRVRALLRKTSARHNLEGIDFETVLGDLGDLDSLRQAVRGIDVVFHLAGVVSARSREEYFRHNALGTGNLARACAEANPGLKRFVYVSSLAASGPSSGRTLKTEAEPEAPVSAYGESKLGGERALSRWSKGGELFPISIVRPPTVYGPRDKAVFEFVKIVNCGIIPVLRVRGGRGEKLFSAVHVEDLVDGIVRAGFAEGQARREVFFICGDGTCSWSEAMGAIAEALGRKAIRVPVPTLALTGFAAVYAALGFALQRSFPLTLDRARELGPDYWICSNERAKTVLGFGPKWTLRQGLSQTVSWYRQSGWI